MNRMEEPILSEWTDAFQPVGTGPTRPLLDLATARRAALSQLRARLRTEPELVAGFWTEIASPDRIAKPELTLLYAQLTYAGKSLTLFEFVSGETLEELVRRADPADCESAIPLFCRVLDAFEEADRKSSGPTLAPSSFADSGVALADFGLCRVACNTWGRSNGTVLLSPSGLSPEEIIREDQTSRQHVLSMLLGVYQSLSGQVPAGAEVEPAELNDIFIAPLGSRLRKLEMVVPPQPETETSNKASRLRVPSILVAIATAAVVLVGLFGVARVMSELAPRQSLMALPKFPPLPIDLISPEQTPAEKASVKGAVLPITVNAAAKPVARPPIAAKAPATVVAKPPESPRATATPGNASAVPTAAGLTRGARLLTSPALAYPEKAKEQRVFGVVRLEVLIDEDGTVKQPRILSGHPLLRSGLVDAVKQWVYQPALLNGRPVPMTTEIEIKFNLDQPQK